MKELFKKFIAPQVLIPTLIVVVILGALALSGNKSGDKSGDEHSHNHGDGAHHTH